MQFLIRGLMAALVVLTLLATYCFPFTGAGVVGVNYGTVANNLPTPAVTAKLILSTSLRSVKLYDADVSILQALANTNIKVIVAVGNDNVAMLAASAAGAQSWVQNNLATYMPATQIVEVAVGNEVLTTAAASVTSQLVTALTNVHAALVTLKLDSTVRVTTPHSLGILNTSFPPSAGVFQTQYNSTLSQLLSFLNQTGAPMMVNAYPYFAYIASPNNVSLNYVLFENNTASLSRLAPRPMIFNGCPYLTYTANATNVSLNYVLFQNNTGIVDNGTNLHYSNMLDAQVDAVYAAMARLGYTNVSVSVGETGWPSTGDPTEIGVSVTNAQQYNGNLIKHITSNAGTPMKPNVSVDAYIFALYNENLKPGPTSERNYGLFNPDQSPVYNVGLTAVSTGNSSSPPPPTSTNSSVSPAPTPASPPPPSPAAATPPSSASAPPPSTGTSPPPYTSPPGKTWCVAKSGSSDAALTTGLNFACGPGFANCGPIQAGGSCYQPNTLASHATWAYNDYYRRSGNNYWDCYFNGTGVVTITDPSYSGCTFP